jgi:hypothetical protein
MRHTKRQESMSHNQERIGVVETVTEETYTLDLLNKDSEIKELKEMLSKELTESIRMTSHQIENTNKEIETIKRNHTETLS